MSKISAITDYDGQLRMDGATGNELFKHNWGEHTVVFNTNGLCIITEFELSRKQKLKLAAALVKSDPNLPSKWPSLNPELHRIIEKMVDQLLEAASNVDNSLRKLPRGLRLAPLQFRERSSPSGPVSPVIYWHLSDDEKEVLKPVFEKSGAAVNSYKDGIEIPMPDDFERRQVHLSETEIKRIIGHLEQPSAQEPFRTLYSIAADNFLDRYYDSAVMILATSIETALKSWLVKNSDPISDYILTNVQSPPIDRLYSCARKHTNLNLPKHFGPWLIQLRNARNEVAHRHEGAEIDFLELARWFAVVEAILGAFTGNDIDPLIGSIVKPKPGIEIDNFPNGSHGVVLRREVLHRDHSYHILIDSGATWRFDESVIEKSDEQAFLKIHGR